MPSGREACLQSFPTFPSPHQSVYIMGSRPLVINLLSTKASSHSHCTYTHSSYQDSALSDPHSPPLPGNHPLTFGFGACYNNSKHASTHTSPFEGLYGLSPLTPVKLIEPPHAETPDILQRIHDIHSLLEEQIKLAKAEQKHHADNKSKIREFAIGDYVLLSTKHLTLYNQPCKKFKDRYIGPYKIMAKYSPHVYKLELPSTMTIHPVFHITSLTPYYSDTPIKT